MPTRLQSHLQELGRQLKSLGHQVRWAEASPGTSHTLLVNLAGTDAEAPLWLELCYLAALEEEIENADILQCFLPILTNVAFSQHAALCRMIALLNVKLPLVGFGFQAKTGLLFFKHNALLPHEGDAINDLVARAVSLIGYEIATMAEPLISVAARRKSEAQALAEHRFSHLV
jgi:hypothetical protein